MPSVAAFEITDDILAAYGEQTVETFLRAQCKSTVSTLSLARPLHTTAPGRNRTCVVGTTLTHLHSNDTHTQQVDSVKQHTQAKIDEFQAAADEARARLRQLAPPTSK
jgi:hypothetical protein